MSRADDDVGIGDIPFDRLESFKGQNAKQGGDKTGKPGVRRTKKGRSSSPTTDENPEEQAAIRGKPEEKPDGDQATHPNWNCQ